LQHVNLGKHFKFENPMATRKETALANKKARKEKKAALRTASTKK